MKKFFRIVLIIFGILLFLLFLASLFAAPFAKRYINKHGEELVGRRIQVDELRLNIYTGHLALRHTALYEEDGTTPFVSFDTFDVRVKPFKLMRSELYVKELTLAGLNVRVEQRDTVFNFTSMLDYLSRNDTTPPDTTSSEWMLSFHNVVLRHGEIHYADLGRDSQWDFNNLNLRIPDFSMGGEQASKAGLTLMLGEEGRLSADMHYDVKSNDINATIELQRFNLEQVLPYLTDKMRLERLQGYMALHLDMQGNLSRITDLLLAAQVTVEDLHVADRHEELLACRQIAVDCRRIDLAHGSYQFGTVAIDGLESHYDVRENGSSFSDLMMNPAPADKPNGTAANSSTTTPDLRIERFVLSDAAFTYADYTLPDTFVFPIKNIQLTAEQIRLAGENAARITANLPDGGRAVVRWKGNITHWQQHQDLLLVISNLKLTLLNPYMLAMLGQPFTDGNLSFQSVNRINNGQLEGRNHLDIFRADVGKRRSDVDAQMRLPLRAALYILKDKDDKIDLEIPVSGDVNNPEFSYMKMVWKTLGNLLVKIVASPLRALGDMLGFNGENWEYMEIAPDQFDFSSEQYYHIEQLVRLMQRDTMIHVDFQQQLPSDLEDEFLQRADHRNLLLEHHLTELGLAPQQFSVSRLVADTIDRTGYRFNSSLSTEE